VTEHARLDPDTGGLLLSDRAWRAVLAIGADGEAEDVDAGVLEALEALDLVREEQLDLMLARAVQAIGNPLAELMARRRGLELSGWIDAEAAVLLVPRGAELSELSVVAARYLPELLARLLELGPRPAPVGGETSATPGALAQVMGAGGAPSPVAGLPPVRDHWELEISASGPPRHRERLEVADTEDGLRLLVPEGEAVRLVPATPSQVWRLLTGLVTRSCAKDARQRPPGVGG